MSSQNIAVQRQVYDALRKERRPGESFTRLLDRMLSERGALGELQGVWGSGRRAKDRAALSQLRGKKA